MSKVKKKSMFVLALLCVLALAACLIPFGAGAAKGDGGIAERYSVGETVKFPPRTLSSDGKSAQAETVVTLPDGSAVREGELLLEQAGVYTVEYRAVIDGKLVRETESFRAIQRKYSATGSKSVLRYGEDQSAYQTGLTGINVSLAQKEKFEFNEVIDLNACDGKPFFRFHVLPKTQGQRDASALYIYLTDIRDPENYLTIKVQSVAYNGQPYVYVCSYVLASPCGQTLVGQDWTEKDRVHVNDRFGAPTYMSFYANGEKPVGEEYTEITYKIEEKQLWLTSHKMSALLVDFDDPKYAKYFDDLWGGFTSNEVLLSCEADGYTGTHFNFLITDVAGSDLSKAEVEDDLPPVIGIDAAGYDLESLPEAVAGQSYPLFEATAFDTYSGKVAVEAHAYYGYGSTAATEVEIAGGRVSTPHEGIYTVVYTATDWQGNVAKRFVKFGTGDSVSPSLSLSSSPATGLVGESVPLAEMSPSGGSGRLETAVFAEKDGKSIEVSEGFVPQEAGEYTLRYTVTDVTGRSASVTRKVEVEQNPNPVFEDFFYLPSTLIAGQAYRFPEVSAYDFGKGENVRAELWINGVKSESETYTPQTAGTLRVKYIARTASSGVAETEERTIQVVDVYETAGDEKVLKLAGYFSASGFEITQRENEIAFALQSENGTFSFIKPLMVSHFELGLRFDPNKTNFAKMEILLTDAENPARTLTLGLVKDADAKLTRFYLNGERTPYVVKSGGLFSSAGVKFSYSEGRILDGNEISIKISEIFPATKALLSVKIEGAAGDEEVCLTNLNGQLLTSSVVSDRLKPQGVLVGEYGSQFPLNDTLDVLPVVVEDLLDTDVTALVEVMAPDGTKLLSGADARKAHTVKLGQYGAYMITYVLKDGSNNTERIYRTVYVLDSEPPVVTLEGSLKDAYRTGSTVTLPKATASDAVDGDVKVKVLVVDALGKIRVLSGEKFTFDRAGRYTFRYYAEDAAGNIAMSEIPVTVEG